MTAKCHVNNHDGLMSITCIDAESWRSLLRSIPREDATPIFCDLKLNEVFISGEWTYINSDHPCADCSKTPVEGEHWLGAWNFDDEGPAIFTHKECP